MNSPLVRRSPTHAGTVLANVEVTPRMRRVTVRAESMRGVVITPAQDVELHLREDSGRRVKRRYTIRAGRPDDGELDLDVLLHGASPGSHWGRSARPGDDVAFQGPRGKLELRPAPHHLLLGDESALPAIATVCAALPEGETATALIEVDDARDEQPVSAARLRWVHRAGAEPGTPDLLRDALADVEVPPGSRAYLLGESRAMIALRPLVEGRGVVHDDVFVKGYWNHARPDRIAGRPPR
ncbi:NADPH-dependent ferric siderophore reductase, contains FAD-binding and SIP domains [Jatrophihabitans endophyticus]|uniref:NADPH-dependent ferric siderophore reductase, contains FAD-binding and SIP domains n=1 Tax=Jatrophihabitans endophyticus TaxID=1206085 RepID=A0A1M5ICS5_9ACTN|nr:siderophore-interacting protein [Jatrophihabitans endophyticus]SHG26106.1 NADPH-dependent ferric siderophore reductase, contains FAD-binding and SIP domains [Jatrophihabitans endophyticus]